MAYKIVMFGEKRIGLYNTELNIFIKHGVKKSKHLFQKMDAWGVDENTFKNILKEGCRIIIEEVEEQKRYETTKEKMLAGGEYMNFGEHGLQLFLPREKWTVSDMRYARQEEKENQSENKGVVRQEARHYLFPVHTPGVLKR